MKCLLLKTAINGGITQEAVRSVPLMRHADPSEMACIVLMMVSDAGSYLNGESIVVGGGMTATRL